MEAIDSPKRQLNKYGKSEVYGRTSGAINTIESVVILLCLCAVLPAQSKAKTIVPRFDDYPVFEKLPNRNAPVIIPKEGLIFRARLQEAAMQQPNFAGHYILTTWGCGMECLMGAVIDTKIGKIYQIPFTICCFGDQLTESSKPIKFFLNSKLIIFYGKRNEDDNDTKKHYYIFDKNFFIEMQ